jgi:hypothetical protein
VTGATRALGLLLLVGGLLTAACSPEATRVRNGGPGGDIGNRSAEIQIHGRIDPYYETPQYGRAGSR